MEKLNLQLFALSKGSSSTRGGSTTSSSSEGGSSESSSYSKAGGSQTHTEGQSETSKVGGSQTHTDGGSESHAYTNAQAHSTGGSQSASLGHSYASGVVSDKTQAQFNKYGDDYVQSDAVTNAYDRLQQTLSGTPTFQSKYENQLNDIYNQIMNREDFSYDFNKDAMYNLYKDQYTTQGKKAMQDTLGQAQSMNGGYGSSYAQSAAQQTYQDYLQDLNNMIPTLRNQAYSEYQDQYRNLLDKYNISSDAYQREYGQYRDQVADWQSDRNFNYGMYSDERNFDYGQFSDNRNFWQNEYWNERNSAQTNDSQSAATNYSDTYSSSTTDQYAKYWEDSQTNYWENSQTKYSEDSQTNWWEAGQSNSTSSNWNNAFSNTNSWQDTNSMSQSFPTGRTGGSSGNNNGNQYREMSFQNQANTAEEAKARYQSAISNSKQIVPSVGNYEGYDMGDLSKSSSLRNEEIMNDVLSKLQKAQNQNVGNTLVNLTDKYDLDDKDLKVLKAWLDYYRGAK